MSVAKMIILKPRVTIFPCWLHCCIQRQPPDRCVFWALADWLELLDESDKVVLDLTRTTVTSDGATEQPAQKVPTALPSCSEYWTKWERSQNQSILPPYLYSWYLTGFKNRYFPQVMERTKQTEAPKLVQPRAGPAASRLTETGRHSPHRNLRQVCIVCSISIVRMLMVGRLAELLTLKLTVMKLFVLISDLTNSLLPARSWWERNVRGQKTSICQIRSIIK